ncbi:light-harvesting complex-like protein OHP1, chloroplastic isoform X2 [Selaginella moellendorffii]|uniref:light-harvesting complex-like protein OHP1, chloroplastic isoform X2 n=1 Tax=Selaginella moellendorffii TaxID=88036 RepID=UPI000D1C2223|nr:light-harvesting complex-like protein OHP1, chloroplastic isoform X2 [Selaginella moellendorffii]|eukprot:XP_024532557.1 light-harvesting complex-like protein OHP1, chloroplastic isoform X2 [Selaginella moellendorffii]
MAMAAIAPTSLFGSALVSRRGNPSYGVPHSYGVRGSRSMPCVRAASPKLKGIDLPKENPKLPVAFWGFTSTAELWNARTAMLGIVGMTLVELILGRGILQTFGIEVGKGLNLPL